MTEAVDFDNSTDPVTDANFPGIEESSSEETGLDHYESTEPEQADAPEPTDD